MARARNIKPGFFTNDELADLDPLARILFAGLWTIADREGRLEDRVKKIKAAVLPYDECDCDRFLRDLHDHGFILRYEAGEKQYIQIIKWGEHQNPHVKEAESTIPKPCENSARTVHASDKELKAGQPKPERAGLIPDSLNPITDSLNLIPDTGIQVNPHVEQTPLDAIPEIFAYWQKVMRSPRSVLDDKRKKIIKSALKNYSPADICKAIRGCSKSPYHMGKNKDKTVYNGLNLILRNAEYIDKFIAVDVNPNAFGNESDADRTARIMAEFCGESVNDENTIEMEA